jgi:hypothetical protein
VRTDMLLFDAALADLTGRQLAFWGPKSFRDYLAAQGISENNKTAQHISVDSLERLHPSLRANDVMVLRLGASEGLGTQFGLVKAEGQLSDFFLVDSKVFGDVQTETFYPTVTADKLMPFRLLPAMSETGLVNFAFASGLLAHALRLDDEHSMSAQATGASTFTFDVRPHSNLDVVVRHRDGQVQVDSLFVGQRQGQKTLFVLEAKSSPAHKSLAKHKLVYPLLALASRVPAEMPIVPVYLKVSKSDVGLRLSVAKCSFPDPRKVLAGINELRTEHSASFFVPE